MQKQFLSWLSAVVFFVIVSMPIKAFSVEPSLTSPEEQSRQINFDALQQQRKLETQRLLKQQQEKKTDVRGDVSVIRQDSELISTEIPENETPCYVINKIELVGDRAAEFQFASDSVLLNLGTSAVKNTKNILGRCLGVIGINAIMSRVQNEILTKPH